MEHKEEQGTLDKYIIGVNIAALIGFFFIYQAAFSNDISKAAIFLALTLFVISLIAYIWHLHRLPIRRVLWKKFANKTSAKYAHRIQKYLDTYVSPLAKYEVREEYEEKLRKVKTEEDMRKFKAEVQQEKEALDNGTFTLKNGRTEAGEYIAEAFAHQLSYEVEREAKKIFKSPLKEKRARIKFIADQISKKFRLQIFISGFVFTLFSFYIEILSR